MDQKMIDTQQKPKQQAMEINPMPTINEHLDLLRQHIQATASDQPEVMGAFVALESQIADVQRHIYDAKSTIRHGAKDLGIEIHVGDGLIHDILPRIIERAKADQVRIRELHRQVRQRRRPSF